MNSSIKAAILDMKRSKVAGSPKQKSKRFQCLLLGSVIFLFGTETQKASGIGKERADDSNRSVTEPSSKPEQKTVSESSSSSVAPGTKIGRPNPAPPKSVKDFFTLHSVKLLKSEPKDGVGVWSFKEYTTPENRTYNVPDQFQPCLEVSISTEQNIRPENTFVRAYYFDKENKLMATQKMPSESGKRTLRDVAHYAMPTIFRKNSIERVFFAIPPSVKDKQWRAVVVFGDRFEAQSVCFPSGESDFLLSYPERALVYDRTVKTTKRRLAMDPLIEHVVKTRNPQMPQMTLFLKMPQGVIDTGEIQGVLAVCVLATNVEAVKRDMQKNELNGDYSGLFGFARKHKLAVLAWGSRGLWDPTRNYEELSREEKREADRSFDLVSNAWEQGVQELASQYDFPTKDFLLWGSCGSAQWAHRLCLRKPEYFLAIGIHNPGSFDKPTVAANKVLWCLTMGELYGGYERSKRFSAECQTLGYPFIFKAIVGLGHAGHPDVTALNFHFFEFALSQKSLREAYEKGISTPSNPARQIQSGESIKPWPQIFQHPPFYGDIVNQEVYPARQVEMIPAGFRIPLPNKEIADIWSQSR